MTVADVTVVQALTAVMEAVGAVRKGERVTSGPAQFNFRGIDAVVNAVSPALRENGVVVSPKVLDLNLSQIPTSRGGMMQRVIATVEYTFHGPAGDSIAAVTAGEAFDSGDKATSKAMSVAFRTALLQTLALPTDEPDPDSTTYDGAGRAEQPQRQATPQVSAAAQVLMDQVVEYVDGTSPGEDRDVSLRKVYRDAKEKGLLGGLVNVPKAWVGETEGTTTTLANALNGARAVGA